LKAHHFSQHRADHHTGTDDPLHLEPVDLSTIPPTDYPKHEGAPVMPTAKIFEFFDTHGPINTPEATNEIEGALDSHYSLAGTGWGIAFDVRDRTARLVKL